MTTVLDPSGAAATAEPAAEPVTQLAGQLDRVVEQLLVADLTCSSKEVLLTLWRAVESARRRLEAVEFRVINRAVELDLAYDHGCTNVAALIRSLFQVTPAQARSRMRDAASFGPRRDLQGNPIGAVFPLCADAVIEGAITVQAARSIQRAIERLPHDVTARIGTALEEHMVTYARGVDAGEAARFADLLAYRYDQDGQLDAARRRHARRAVTRHRRTDGSATFTIEATCELAELIDTALDATAAPAPAKDGTPDPRTHGQRLHDGLITIVRGYLSSGLCPDTAGCRTTVVLHADADQFARSHGEVTTGHGYAVPFATAEGWLDPYARAVLVLLSDAKGIEAYSSVQRLFTEQQRLVMQARDRGCTTPDCDRPAAWCQAHHVTDYQITHHTRVDDGALVCGEHHRTFEALGWRTDMINGRPAWIPPRWIDADQQPRTNTRHHPPDLTAPDCLV